MSVELHADVLIELWSMNTKLYWSARISPIRSTPLITMEGAGRLLVQVRWTFASCQGTS